MGFTINDILPFDEEGVTLTTENSVLVGLEENSDKGITNKVGRTFLGLAGKTVYIFNGPHAT